MATSEMKSGTPGKTRYALAGTGARAQMYLDAILKTYTSNSSLVALCDLNRKRMQLAKEMYAEEIGNRKLPGYRPRDFDRMVAEARPDVVIVTTVDRSHHQYIIRAMELGCDVITEKPMTVDAEKCQAILDTVKRTGRKLRVTFNYRYSPVRAKVRELIRDGVIGDIRQVHFEWLLDTVHGADYFRRWHRDKINSGGLMVHKATHHFDLVNWWIDSTPELVFGLGSLAFYGRANAEERGVEAFYDRGTGHPNAKEDPFALDLSGNEMLRKGYLEAESEDGYRRDQSVFGDGISIEDTMNVVVRYASGAQMSYSLCAYQPWEGYVVNFTGTRGRIELKEVESSYVSGREAEGGLSMARPDKITVFPHWATPYAVEPPEAVGGHGGGDAPLLEDIFASRKKRDPLRRAAGHEEGAWSILTGIAANESFATGRPVRTRELVTL